MRYLKMLGLAAAVAMALVVFAAPASATNLTAPAGTNYTGGLKLVSEGEILIDNEFGLGAMRCSWTLEGKVESHGPTVTAAGKFTSLAITGCTDGTVLNTVFAAGSFEVHPDSPPHGNGTVTVSGLEFTITHPGAFNCKFSAGAGIDFGTLVGTATTGSNATLDVNGVKLPKVADSPFLRCGRHADRQFQSRDPLDAVRRRLGSRQAHYPARRLRPSRLRRRARVTSDLLEPFFSGPGVSRVAGRPSKRGSERKADRPLLPISPLPILAWRSRLEPSGSRRR